MTALILKWARIKYQYVKKIFRGSFNKSRSGCKAKKHNYDQAKKAMHLLYKRIRNLNLPTDLQLQLFEHTILPIAFYECEVWACENTNIIEKLEKLMNFLGILQIQRNPLQYICYMQNLAARLLMLKSKPYDWLLVEH